MSCFENLAPRNGHVFGVSLSSNAGFTQITYFLGEAERDGLETAEIQPFQPSNFDILLL